MSTDLAPLCIYHDGCLDGIAAAWVVWTAFNGRVIFHPGDYRKPPPVGLAVNRDVYVVDFSYKPDDMLKLAEAANATYILDHHQSAVTSLDPLLTSCDTVRGFLDTSACGALLTWRWFYPGQKPPIVLQHIDARDRWVKPEERPLFNDQVIMALRSVPSAAPVDGAWTAFFSAWSDVFAGNVHSLVPRGTPILEYYRLRCAEVAANAINVIIDGRHALAVNAPYFMASDVAHTLIEPMDAPPVALAWYVDAHDQAVVSVRTRRGEVRADLLAEIFGGGGHATAAGFRARADVVQSWRTAYIAGKGQS